MHRPAVVWVGTLGVLAAYDVWCARNAIEGDSLSEVTRAALRTDTRQGQALFVLGWGALTAWLVPHICRSIADTAAVGGQAAPHLGTHPLPRR